MKNIGNLIVAGRQQWGIGVTERETERERGWFGGSNGLGERRRLSRSSGLVERRGDGGQEGARWAGAERCGTGGIASPT